MTNHHLHTKEFLVGAAVGSVLGSVTALLIAPKTGKKLCKEICNAYSHISDTTHDLADKGKSLAKSFTCHKCHWAKKAKSMVDGARKTARDWGLVEEEPEEKDEQGTKDFFIGSIAGGILGAAVALLLTPKSGEELRQNLKETYEDVAEKTQDFGEEITKKGKCFAKTARCRGNKWLELAKDLVDELTEGAHEKGEDLLEHVKGLINNKRTNEAIDWAHLGYRLWQRIRPKR